MRTFDRRDLTPWLALAAVGTAVFALDVCVIPVLLNEGARDWRAYAGAAGAISSGAPLYPWAGGGDIRGPAPYPYLYPPPLAVIWLLGLTPALLLVLKIVSVTAVYPLARRVAGATVAGGVAATALALATPPLLHDLILGNVMAFYLAAVCLAVAFPGWIGSTALGVLCAVALKPAIGPVLLFLALRRRDDFLRTLAVGAIVTVGFALVVGPGRYVEYVRAIPALTGLAAPFTGNVGLSAISPAAGLASVVLAYAATLFAARLDERLAASVAIAACVVAQPTLGLNYAVLLVPAVLLVWPVSRRLALVTAVLAPAALIVSTVGTTLVLIGATTARGLLDRRNRGSAPEPSTVSAAVTANG